jgi:hypothetical protein
MREERGATPGWVPNEGTARRRCEDPLLAQRQPSEKLPGYGRRSGQMARQIDPPTDRQNALYLKHFSV